MPIIQLFSMRAWNTNLSEFVTWEVELQPDFVGTYSGYPTIDLENIAVVDRVRMFILSYTNSSRPAASGITAGTAIWNTDDDAPQWSDGTNWRDGMGNIT
jgi:hypothetical protein